MSMAMVNINYNKIFEIFENSIAISSNIVTSSISVLRFLKRNILTSQRPDFECSPRSVVEGEGEGGGEGDDEGGEEKEEAGGKDRP